MDSNPPSRRDKLITTIREKLEAKRQAKLAIPQTSPPPRYDEEYYNGVLWIDSLAYSQEETQAYCFYLGKSDHKDRKLTDILQWDDQQLETCHDYIQWLFPIDQPSEFNPNAPVLSYFEIKAFRTNPTLRKRLEASVERFTRFLDNTKNVWVVYSNHNHLRISRVLRCMTLLGMQEEANALLQKLLEQCRGIVNDESILFWEVAVQ